MARHTHKFVKCGRCGGRQCRECGQHATHPRGYGVGVAGKLKGL